MFEFHGWAVLRYHTHDTDEMLQDKAVNNFKKYIADNDPMKLSMTKTYNGQDSFLISGLHNHKSKYVIEIYNWIAVYLPGSYGLLYIQDDEDTESYNIFTVLKLARGKVQKVNDPFLSPYVPTVEDEYDPTRND